ncbi:hypothetical protein KC19_VG089600 [Ceratodon purpureus]|uniref:Uncharacterized protein n=1 Tax=Ceratodon purpureus TaxID=3225 RepID=A0A8T0HNJ2_CERPU|nr:hypothetical protein KC19_VG089600 [Ceratodon purpureus]
MSDSSLSPVSSPSGEDAGNIAQGDPAADEGRSEANADATLDNNREEIIASAHGSRHAEDISNQNVISTGFTANKVDCCVCVKGAGEGKGRRPVPSWSALKFHAETMNRMLLTRHRYAVLRAGQDVIDLTNDNGPDNVTTDSSAKNNEASDGLQELAPAGSSEALCNESNTVPKRPREIPMFPDFRSVPVPRFTPLQKWEFLNGLPVDGVEDVEKWAVDVGLLEEDPDSSDPKKKRKTMAGLEPPKYGTSSRTFEIEACLEEETNANDAEEKKDDEVHASTSSRKGKEKEDNLNW